MRGEGKSLARFGRGNPSVPHAEKKFPIQQIIKLIIKFVKANHKACERFGETLSCDRSKDAPAKVGIKQGKESFLLVSMLVQNKI